MTTAYDQDTGVAATCCTVSATKDTDTPPVLDSCCTPTGQGDSDALGDIKAHEIAPEIAALRTAGFQLLLDQGTPVELQNWANTADITLATLRDVIDRNSGRVELDEHDRLIGIAGLTIKPTHHELDINGTKRWTWCALDAVGIFGALKATGTINSIDPRTQNTVTIEFKNGQPQGDATIFILGGYDGGDIRDQWCPLVNFFNTQTDAETWVKDNQVTGDILTVNQITKEATEMWQTVTNPNTQNAS